jgi:hypothetical protein
MPVTLPNCDDRTWKDLVEEGRALAVTWAPEWTDQNVSDPGITIMELFAFLTEALIYRTNRISTRHVWRFLKLINGPEWKRGKGHDLEECIRTTLRSLNDLERAVTLEDFEVLAKRDTDVGRAWCVPRTNLSGLSDASDEADAAGHIDILIVPAANPSKPSHVLLHEVRQMLEPYRLLGTRLHVRSPRYVTATAVATLKIIPGAIPVKVRDSAHERLTQFVDPLIGGAEGEGWTLGRDLYVSEVCQVLQRVPGVESVRKTIDPNTKRPLEFLAVEPQDAARLKYNHLRDLEAVELKPFELVRIAVALELA